MQRRLAIIGEASNKLSDSYKEAHSDVPWNLIRSMRNRLVHSYNEIDIELVWTTITSDIPVLKEKIQQLLPD